MDPELKRLLSLSDLHDSEPSLKRASQWLMKPVELERRLSLVWQGDESAGEDECTAWWLLRCMGRYLGAEEVVDEQQARVVYRRFGTPDPEYWFLAHVVVHGHRYFRYDSSFILPGQNERDGTLRVLRSAIPHRDQDWYPSYSPDPDQWLVVRDRSPLPLALLMLRLWQQKNREFVGRYEDRWDLVQTCPDLQKMAYRLIPRVSLSRLPACALKLQAKCPSLFEARVQLTIMLKQAGANESVARESVPGANSKLTAELYAKETHGWSCHTMQKKGYCPFVDIEDAAAAKCLANFMVVTRGKGKQGHKIGISPEAFIKGTTTTIN